MKLVYEEIYNKAMRITQHIRTFSLLADKAGMKAEAQMLADQSDELGRYGIFQLVFLGTTRVGKNTLINALVGRIMMATRATACTAVIATVEYGNDANMVTVVNTNGSTRRMTLEQFTNEFQITEEEEETIINDNGKLDRFAEVSHVEMQSNDELFRDGVHLIDSPGLEEAVSRTKTTNEYVPKANAIIFTLSAASLFSAKEKEYIAENFAGKHMRNIFFVINRIDNLTPGQLEASVMPAVRSGLTDVFTDENGVFDEALYNKRVFFTNAYGAQCVRIGEPYKAIVGKKEVNIPIEIEDTGMPEFEAALREFLNSKDRLASVYYTSLRIMSTVFILSKSRQKALEELEMKQFDTEIECLKDINDQMRTICIDVYRDLYGLEPSEEIICQFGRIPVYGSFNRYIKRGSDAGYGNFGF